jgi:hypothetical protein
VNLEKRRLSSRSYSRARLYLAVASLIGVATTVFGLVHQSGLAIAPLQRQQTRARLVIRVVNGLTHDSVRNAILQASGPSGAKWEAVTDSAGNAEVTFWPNSSEPTVVSVVADGFQPSENVISVAMGTTAVYTIALRPIEKQPPAEALPYSRVFSSGPVLSGSGGNFSGWYEVEADPPQSGFVIDLENSSYSISGDRQCGAWAECTWGVRNSQQLSFRFRLQGHSEWPAPGQSWSEGFLKVAYKPEPNSRAQ